MPQPISIDNQPISATFFGEGRWLTDFVTPDALEVKELHDSLTKDIDELGEIIKVCRDWVANNVRYTRFVKGKVWMNGKTSVQGDLWNLPSVTARVGVGNCANMSFLVCSLLRKELPADEVYVVLGNLHNGKPGGHGWVEALLGGTNYIIETTRADVPALVPASAAERYEAVHLFNDQKVLAVEGRTIMEPMTECYSTWLRDYLSWSYIESQRGKSHVH